MISILVFGFLTGMRQALEADSAPFRINEPKGKKIVRGGQASFSQVPNGIPGIQRERFGSWAVVD